MIHGDALERMKALQGPHKDGQAHCDADDILVEVLRSLGYDELCDAYEIVDKWYA